MMMTSSLTVCTHARLEDQMYIETERARGVDLFALTFVAHYFRIPDRLISRLRSWSGLTIDNFPQCPSNETSSCSMKASTYQHNVKPGT